MLTFCQFADNKLAALPGEIGRLVALDWLNVSELLPLLSLASPAFAQLADNALMSLPAELGQLSVLERLDVRPHR